MKRVLLAAVLLALGVIASPVPSTAAALPPVSHRCVNTPTFGVVHGTVCIDTEVSRYGSGFIYKTTVQYICADTTWLLRCVYARGLAQQYVSPLGWGGLHRFGCGVGEALECAADRNYDYGVNLAYVGAGVHHYAAQVWNAKFNVDGILLAAPTFRVDRYDRLG